MRCKNLVARQFSKTNGDAGDNLPIQIHFGEERGILKGERMSESDVTSVVCHSPDLLSTLSGVLLVRFLPLLEENEQKPPR